MNSIHLDVNSFWKWMSLGAADGRPGGNCIPRKSNKEYVQLLSLMMEGHWGSIAFNRPAGEAAKGIRTLDRLSRCIPRKYFVELLYCLAAYSSVFATLFPSMLPHLDNLAYIEWLLYMETDDERYRDHLVHMFQVAYACDRIMQLRIIRQKCLKFQFSSQHFLKWCQEQRRTDPSSWSSERQERVLYAAIYLSAIFHDVGYGYHFLCKYRQRLAGLLPALTQGEATADLHHRDMINMRDSLAAKYVSKHHHAFREIQDHKQKESPSANREVILSGFFRDNLTLNHSTASGILLMDLARGLYDHNAISDDLFISFHLAAEAAMLHDMTKKDRWLHFSTQKNSNFLDCKKQREVPIATLLCFADNMELGGRPRCRPISEDTRCTFLMKTETGEKSSIKYDEEKQCLSVTPQDRISKEDFIFDSKKNCFVLLGIPIRESDSKS